MILPKINKDNKITIDNYISKNDCKFNQTRTEFLNGEPKILQGYRLPRKLLFYNIKNGRFALEYVKILREQGGALNPEDTKDAKKIQDLLLNLKPIDTKRTYEDIKRKGQTDLILITQDGYVIDGNRRMSVIAKLFEDTGDRKFELINAARIEESVDVKDLWAMEAGISLGQDPKVRYGPLNELLKLDEGRKAGFTSQQIADLLYGVDDAAEIDKDLARLDLIRKYLREYYNGDDENLSPVDGYHEHFIDLQTTLINAKKRNKPIDEQLACQKVGFRLIHDKVQHTRILTINRALNNDYPLEKIVEAAEKMEDKTEVILDPELDDDATTPTVVRFIDFEDEVKARKNADEIPIILNSILNNLSVLKFESDDLKTDEAKEKIRKILTYVKKFTEPSGE